MSKPDFDGLFLKITGPLLASGVICWLTGIISLAGIAAVIFATYMCLVVTNAMERGYKSTRVNN